MTKEKLNRTVQAIAGNIKNRSMVLPLKDYIPPTNWIVGVQCFGKKQGYFVGSIKLLQQKTSELKKKWLKGTAPVKSLFMAVT